ncbi:DUF5776 domain-containing protein [Apilactobacillus nanyangensis]|uniref:DUF5776 domain-containing protein n=1 Tax=Apilactobacillus nanyangensis TaxID=2799579 RepID=UPI0019453D6A|nr:DUF5776 domain-containing protein [Apilactobacillus nanyangensis]
MQYNKNQFNKINDKKVMKKVKKQWVVVSVATLAFLGASAYGMMTTSVSASANTNNTTDNQQSVNNTNSNHSGATQSNTQSVQPTQPAINTTYAGSVTSYNNNDDSVTYTNQIKQGYTDAYNNKSNQSSNISGNGANYYNAAYDGAKAAMSAYNSATQNLGAGTQDYNYYGNTVTKKDSSNNSNNSNNSSSVSQSQTSGKSASAGQNSSNNQSQNTVAPTTDGTPQGVTTADNTNQGGADNPQDASTSVAKYETTMTNKLDSATNQSVKANNANQQIIIPTADNSSIVSEKSKFNNAQGLLNAYSQAVTYVLTQQGMADAESGKWQGIYAGSNGSTQDYYLKSNSSNSGNPYDQAYRGARDAMNAYFTSNSYNGNTSVAQSTNGTTAYNQGFNDVVNQAAQGIVYVQNGQQYSSIMTGNTTPSTVGGNVASGINVVRIANDIDMTNATNGENDGTVNTNYSTLTVDGQNHMVDFHGNNYTVNKNGSGSLDVYLQNFQTVYGANYFGTFRAESGAALHFSNINYVGPQLLSSYNNDTYFSGNVNVLVPTNSNATYTSPFQSNVPIEGGGNQENLEVNNFILQDNSHYFGNTSPVLGGTNVVATGNFTIGQNAKMTLIPRGGNGGAATIADSSTWGVWLKNSGASLNIGKNATLNIIPQLYNNQLNLFGGAVYSNAQVNINIDGGTLNYEGYNGISGYYNQPIDLQGSNQTQINVINGGVLQVLMDSVPDVTSWYSYNSHQSVYNGLINNVGLGNFNVGSNGNLKVGVTNSDSTYNVPYYGPININSVGDNHVIFLKSNAVPMFQTTSGQSGLVKSGEIAAYTVAIKQSDGTKQYLYKFELGSGGTTYSGVDLNGNNVTGNINGNSLEILNVPAVSFVGTLTKTTNNGYTTVTGYAKLSNYEELVSGTPIYVGVASSSSPQTTYNQLTQVANSNISDSYSKADPNTYVQTADTKGYSGGVIPISYTFASGVDTTYVGMRLHYGINTVDTILGPNNYSTTVEGYKSSGSQQVTEDSNGDMQVAGGNLSNLQSGQNDALADMVNGNTASKDGEPFSTKTNSDYLAAYSSVQAGYQAFMSNPSITDYSKLSSYIGSSNPAAFIQGFEKAAYQSGLRDAQFNKNNSSNLTDPAKSQYIQAQNEYNSAYQSALSSTGDLSTPIAVQNFISQNNLPNTNATTQAISDAQGVSAFVKDEQAGSISTSTASSTGNRFSKLTSGQQSAYSDAYTGYQNALTVDKQADNPDANSDKAESAGFDYAQSIINGGLSTTNPSSTAAHMNNVTFAQNGYNAAQQAISNAKTNGATSNDANNLDIHNPGSVSSDSSSDVTAYQYIKIGAYTALKNQSDTGLNTMEKVGYSLVASSQAYANGMNAFDSDTDKNSDTIPTANDPISTSTVGQPQYNQGYNDAKTAYNQGIADAVANARNVSSNGGVNSLSETPASIPSNVAAGAKQEYLNAYKAAIDGYQDGNSGAKANEKGTHYNNSNSDPNYDKSYNSAYITARADAGANDYLTKHSSLATDQPYTTGYDDAAAGHSSGYSAASSAASASTSVPSANQVNSSATAQYTAGFNGGVNDEQNAANALAGANDYLANQTMPSGSAFQAGFSAAESGFKAAQAKSSSASSDTNYSLGYAAYSSVASAWSQDETQSGSASASGSANPTTVTNDVFNATVSSLGGKNYTNSQSSQGNLYQDISQTLGSQAATNYSNGVSSAVSSSGASSNDYFTSLGIKDVNDGYNNASNADTQSTGFQKGQLLKQNESTGAQMALNDVTQNEPSDPQQKAAFEATKAAYQSVADSGSQTAVKDTNLSSQSRAYQDAYNKAFDDANAQKDTSQQTAINAAKTGSGNPFSGNGASDKAWSAVYDSINNGYKDGQSGTQNNSNNDPNYDLGYAKANQFNNDVSTAENNDNPDVIANTNNDDAFKGAAQALKDVYDNGPQSHINQDSTHSADYVKAYNLEVDKANAANKQARDDMTNGVSKDASRVANNDSNVSNASNTATKAIYDHAYDQVATGFDAGLNSSNGSGYPSNSDQQVGYNNATGVDATNGYQAGRDLSKGYQEAVADFLAGNNNPTSKSDNGYADTMNALLAAKSGQSMPTSSSSSSALTKYAYSQEKATMDAIAAAKVNSNASAQPSTIPNGVDSAIYSKAYSAAIDGFKDGHQTPASSTNKKSNDTSSIYTASYAQGLKAGRIQQGAEDYVNGQIDQTIQAKDPDYAQGINDATNGYNQGITGASNGNTSDSAYTLGYNQGKSLHDGLQAAASGDTSALSGDTKNAYYGAKDAYQQIVNPSQSTPSNNQGVDTNSKSYKDAFNKVKQDALSGQNNGVSAFASENNQPTDTSTTAGQAAKDGWKQASDGYNAEQLALKQNPQSDVSVDNQSPAYKAGVQMAKDQLAGEQDAYNGSTTTNATQEASKQAVLAAFNNVKNGTPGAPFQATDSTQKKVYDNEYPSALQTAEDIANNGAQNYLNGGSKNGGSDLQNSLSDSEFDQASKGFQDGLVSQSQSTQSTDIGYQKGFNAAVAAKQAISDQENNSSSNPSDTTDYNNAKTGYVEAMNQLKNSPNSMPVSSSTNPVYNAGFQQAIVDGQNAYQNGVSQAINNPTGTVSTSDYKDSSRQTLVSDGFNDVQNAFKAEINNNLDVKDNTIQSITSPNNANNQGTQLADQVIQAINATVTTDPTNEVTSVNQPAGSSLSQSIQGKITDAIKQAQNDYKNNNSASTNLSGTNDVLTKLAYQQEMKQLQLQSQTDLQSAKTAIQNNQGESNLDDGAKKDYDVMNNAFRDANSGQNNSTDNDANHANNLPDAYNAGWQMASDALTKGAKSFINGSGRNNDSTSRICTSEGKGYDNASAGFNDGMNSESNSQTSNSSYTAGFNAARAVKDVENNIQNNDNKQSLDPDSANQALAGYQDAAAAVKANPTSPASADSTKAKNVAYNRAYTDAVDRLKNQYQTGVSQFTSGQSVPTLSGSKYDKDEINQGFNDASAGFNAAMNNNSNYSHPAGTAQDTGYQLGQKVIDSINSAKNLNNSIATTGQDDLDTAISKARDTVKSNPIISPDTSYPEGVITPLAQQVYKAAVDAFKADYNQGVKNVTQGTTKPADDAPDDTFMDKGQNDASKTIKAGFNGSQIPTELSDVYQMGIDAKNGVNEANNGQSKNTAESISTQNGNDAAQQAISDASKNKTTSMDGQSLLYELSYNQGKNISTTLTTNGQNAFIQGDSRPTGSDSASQLSQSSYDDALAGYNASKNNSKDQKKANDSSYQAGVTAYNDAQKGIELANQHLQTDSVPTTDPNNNNNPLSTSEQLAYQAVMDAYKGNNESNPGNPIYDDAYKQALSDKSNAAKQGALNALNASDSQYTPNKLQNSAYTQGKTDANSGYSAAKSDVTGTVDPNNVNTGINQIDAQNGAKLAFQDALNGKTDSNGAPSNASDVFKAAYSKAMSEAKGYISTGIADAKKNSNPNLTGNDAESKLTQAAYENFMNGYNTENSNKESNSSLDTQSTVPGFKDGVSAANTMETAVSNYELTGKTNGSDQNGNYQQIADDAYNDGVNGNTSHEGTDVPSGDEDALAKADVYSKIQQQAANNAAIGANTFLAGGNKDTNTPAIADTAQGSGFDNASSGFADGNKASATPSQPNNPSYMTGYNAGQAAYQVEQNFESGANNSPSDTTSSQQANSAYNQAISDFNTNHAASDTTANGNKVYQTVYKHAMDQLQTQYSNGINDFNAGKSSPDVTSINQSPSSQAARATGFNDANTEFTKVLTQGDGVKTQNPNSAQSVGAQLADKVLGRINDINTNNQSPQTTGDGNLDNAINAAKNSVLNNPNSTDTSYPDGVAGNNIYQQAYKQAVDSFEAQYAKGVKSTVDPTDNSVDVNPFTQKGQTDAENAITAGFNNSDNTNYQAPQVLADAYTSGQQAKMGMTNGENGQNDRSSSNASYSDKQGNQAAMDAIQSRQNGQTDDNPSSISSKPKSYQLAYKQAMDDANASAIQGAQSLFANNNQDPTKGAQGGSYQIANPTNSTDKAKNRGLIEASQALSDAQLNSADKDSQYDPSTVAGKVYFATKMAYNNVDPSGVTAYNHKVDVINDPVAKAAYAAALANAQAIAKKAAQDYVGGQDNSADYNGNSIAKTLYQDAHDVNKTAFDNGLKDNNPSGKYSNNFDDPSLTYLAVQNAISDYVNNNNQASSTAAKIGVNDTHGVYDKAYQNALAKIQAAVNAGVSDYEAGKTMADISDYGSPDESALGRVAETAAQRAKAGHDDALAGTTAPENASITNDPSYLAGRQYGQQADAGYNTAVSQGAGAPKTNVGPTDDAYDGAIAGYKQASTSDAKNMISNDDLDNYINTNMADKSVAYRDAFKKAYQDGVAKAKSGSDAALVVDPTSDPDSGKSGAAQKAESQGYSDATDAFLDKLHGVNDTDSTANTPASVAGRDKATQILQAIQDTVDNRPNTSNTDRSYQLGLTTAQAAINNAVTDAKAKKSVPANLYDIPVPAGCDPTSYRDVYAAVLDGYNNGYNQRSDQPTTPNTDYDIAYSYAFNKGKASIPTDTSAPTDFLNSQPMPNITDPVVVKAYKQQYDEAQDGFYDALYNKNEQSTNQYYQASYKLAQDGIAGMRLASQGNTYEHRDILKNQSAAFVNGYNGYLKGIEAAKRTLKKNKKLSAKDLLGKDKLYSYTFTEGLKHEVKIQRTFGIKYGTKMALKRHAIPKDIYSHHSESYARAYIATYKKEMRRHMPRYIYNVGTIFTHTHVKFTRHTRIKKYAYSERYNSTVFRVVGVQYYLNRIPRYRLSNGAVVTASQSVQGAYYKKHFNKYRIIKPTGALVHTSKTFRKHNYVRKLYRGEVFKVRKVVKFHGITRLYVGKNEYVTSNKTFVKAIFK